MSLKTNLWQIILASFTKPSTPIHLTQAECLAFFDQNEASGLALCKYRREDYIYSSYIQNTAFSVPHTFDGSSYKMALQDPAVDGLYVCLNTVSNCADDLPATIRDVTNGDNITKEDFIAQFGDMLMLDLVNFPGNLNVGTIRPLSLNMNNNAVLFNPGGSINLGWGAQEDSEGLYGGCIPLCYLNTSYTEETEPDYGKFSGECLFDGADGGVSAYNLYEGYWNLKHKGNTFSEWLQQGNGELPHYRMLNRSNIYLYEKDVIDNIITDLQEVGVNIKYFDGNLNPETTPESGQDENENNPGGGTGTWEIETISMPSQPGAGAALFSNTYALNYRQLLSLSEFIWTNSPINTILLNAGNSNIISAFKGAYLYPFNFNGLGIPEEEIIMGTYAITPFQAEDEFEKLNFLSQISVDFGSLTIQPKYGTFLDYEPYTTMQIYLPYCGIQNIEAGLVYGKELNLKYLLNLESGQGRAIITVDGSPLYTWSCQLGQPISLNQNDLNDKVKNTVLGLLPVGIAAATGGTGAALASTSFSAPELFNNIENLAGLAKSSTIGANGGGTERQMPQEAFIIIKSAKSFVPDNYNKIVGRPSLVVKKLSELEGKGLTIIENPLIDFSTGTEQERLNLIKAMQEGIIL